MRLMDSVKESPELTIHLAEVESICRDGRKIPRGIPREQFVQLNVYQWREDSKYSGTIFTYNPFLVHPIATRSILEAIDPSHEQFFGKTLKNAWYHLPRTFDGSASTPDPSYTPRSTIVFDDALPASTVFFQYNSPVTVPGFVPVIESDTWWEKVILFLQDPFTKKSDAKDMKNQQDVWNPIAESWSKFRTAKQPLVIKFLENKSGKILDLGCGSGRNFVKQSSLEWYGVDFSDAMIKLAETCARQKGIGADLRVAEVFDTGFEDSFFDAIIFYDVLHCIDSPTKRRRAVEEILRVLKPGCEALISVWGRGNSRVTNKPKEGTIPWTVDDTKYERYTYIYDLEELRELLEATGFEIVSCSEDEKLCIVVKKP